MNERPVLSPGQERITGVVEKVSFFSESSGFTVLRLKIKEDRDLVTVVGCVAAVITGQHIEAVGCWQNDKSWGIQFKATHLVVIPPDTLEGISKYLSSGMVKGIGPHLAKVLVKAYGMEVFTVIDEHPEQLLGLPGIGKKKLLQIIAGWSEQRAIKKIMLFLHSHGVSTSKIARIFRVYGDDAVAMVSANPYRLIHDIPGIGFKSADQIARNIGIPMDSPLRARAGIGYTLQELSLEGHCKVPEPMLLEAFRRLLTMPESVLDEALRQELSIGTIVAVEEEGKKSYYMVSLFRAETGVAKSIRRIMQGVLPWKNLDPATVIPKAEKQSAIELSESQRSAVALALSSKFLVITGGLAWARPPSSTLFSTFLRRKS